MSEIIFMWDDQKDQANVIKHGITFQEAATVFADEDAVLFDDPDHSEAEDRFILLGLSSELHMLIVCRCYRDENIVRIISARKATRNETTQYTAIVKGWCDL